MELPRRKGDDRFLAAGRYRFLQESLRSKKELGDVRTLVISASDPRSRLLPYVYYDSYMVPCGGRSIAAALHEVGMQKTRLVYGLWNPGIRPSRAQLDGAPIDMLLISSMQIHSAAAYRLIEDAWTLGDSRPLIIAGGPKAFYQPVDYFGLGPNADIGADVVVTGEEPVLLELLRVLTGFTSEHGTMREAFDRARDSGVLKDVPGLVYAEDGRHDGRHLVNTGVQRLLRQLDDLPMPSVGFRMLERPHRRETLSREPAPLGAFGKRLFVSLLLTRGCKFHCEYCPIPGYNQRTFRRKSPERVVDEFVDCIREMNARYFFGADDNFFNSRPAAEAMLVAMASAQYKGKRLGRQIRFGTESSVSDLYQSRDLLPLARPGSAGLSGVWMGVEDLAARLVDKGQNASITETLFGEMLANDIAPMVMLMHHEDQPPHTPGSMVGLMEQIRFLRELGAVGLQLMVTIPAFGSRAMSKAYEQGLLFDRVGGRPVTDGFFDGNRVIATRRSDAWRMQLNVLRGYWSFYNPVNLIRALLDRNAKIRNRRIACQLWGMAGAARTTWALKGYTWALCRGKYRRATDWPEKLRRPGTPYPELIQSE